MSRLKPSCACRDYEGDISSVKSVGGFLYVPHRTRDQWENSILTSSVIHHDASRRIKTRVSRNASFPSQVSFKIYFHHHGEQHEHCHAETISPVFLFVTDMGRTGRMVEILDEKGRP